MDRGRDTNAVTARPAPATHLSNKTRALLDERGPHGRIAHKGEKAPIQASPRRHVERTHARQSAFHRLARCYERRATVINAVFDLADTTVTVRSLIPGVWTTHHWEDRPVAAREGPPSRPAPSRAQEALGGSGLKRSLRRPPCLLIQGTSQWSMSRTSPARRQALAGNLTL